MFQMSKLLGTPRGLKGNQNKANLEFTPIGKGKVQENLNEEEKENDRFILASKGYYRGKITNTNDYDVTLDGTEEFSTIGNSPFKTFEEPIARPQTYTVETQRENHLLSTGTTSINEQQHKIESLNNENINLKVEIRHLRNLLQRIPDEQVNLVEINIQMEEKLKVANNEIYDLRAQLRSLTNEVADASENQRDMAQKDHEYQSRLHELSQLLQDKDNEIQSYKLNLEEAKHIRSDLDELQQENIRLHDQLKDLMNEKESLEYRYQESMTNNNNDHELKSQNMKLKNKLEQMENDFGDKADQINDLMDQLHNEQGNCHKWEKEYNKLRQELENLAQSNNGDDLSQARTEVLNLRAKVDELQDLNQQIESELKGTSREVEMLRRNGQHENNDLLNQIEYLKEEIKDHQRIETDLRAQINSLIKSKSNGEHNRANVYESQIESLTSNESKLMDMNHKLNNQIAKLKDEIYHLTSTSSNSNAQTQSLQRQNDELKQKVSNLENQLFKFEDLQQESDKQFKVLQKDFEHLNAEYNLIKEENSNLIEQIRSHAKNQSDTALSELDKFNLRRLELKSEGLEQEIDSLNSTINKLKNELDYERSNDHTDELQLEIKRLRRELELSNDNAQIELLSMEIRRLKSELKFEKDRSVQLEQQAFQQSNKFNTDYRPLSSNSMVIEQECHRLSMEKDQLISNLKDVENRYRNLQNAMITKDDMLDRMEIQLKELKRVNKNSYSYEEEEKTQLIKAKASNESRIKQLEIEKESLQKDFEFQIQHYKARIEDILAKQNQNSTEHEQTPIISLLEKRLEDSYKTKNELTDKINQLTTDKVTLQSKIDVAQKEAASLLDMNSTYSQNEKLLKLENSELEVKLNSTQDELSKVTQHCHKLVNKLTQMKGGYGKLEDEYLQKRIDDLNVRLADTHLSSKHPKILEEQVKYYKAKLYDINLKANDLEFMYDFVSSSVKGSSSIIKNNIFEFSKLGLYPEYKAKHKKPTFATVAKFVLAMVRIKKRQEKAEKRRRAIQELKYEIESLR